MDKKNDNINSPNTNNTYVNVSQNNEKKQKTENKPGSKKKTSKKFLIGLIIIFTTVLLLLLCLKSCSSNQLPEPIINSPIGNFIVSGNQMQQNTHKETIQEEVPSITFTGYGKYNVSKDSPLIELTNPEGNFVNMVFTLTDKASGEIIARTNPVAAGEFVYVNVVDFYKTPGTYSVEVVVSTYDNETNQPMNGITQNMEISISK